MFNPAGEKAETKNNITSTSERKEIWPKKMDCITISAVIEEVFFMSSVRASDTPESLTQPKPRESQSSTSFWKQVDIQLHSKQPNIESLQTAFQMFFIHVNVYSQTKILKPFIEKIFQNCFSNQKETSSQRQIIKDNSSIIWSSERTLSRRLWRSEILETYINVFVLNVTLQRPLVYIISICLYNCQLQGRCHCPQTTLWALT